jgi:hypothetical protein
LEIGDETENDGVKPDGTNFSNEELLVFYEDEKSNVIRAAARACEVLARKWANVDESVRIRDYQITARQQASNYRALAEDLRKRSPGRATATLQRKDAYSDD